MSLRSRLLLTNALVVGAVLVTLLAVTLLLAPTLHDRLMLAMGAPLHDSHGEMTLMAQATEQAFRGAMLQALSVAAAVALLVGSAVSLLTTRQLVAPIAALLRGSRRIAAGEYAQRVPQTGDAELRTLAAQFNAMAAALQQTEQRRQRLIADVAHELRTPLATIQGYAEGVLDGVVDAAPATWELIRAEALRLGRLTDDLRDLSRAEAGQLDVRRVPSDLADLCSRAAAIVAPQFQHAAVQLDVERPPRGAALVLDPERMTQVLVNLLTNALHATPAGGTVTLRVAQAAAETRISVVDSGVGIAAEHLPQLFERFYRVDPARSRSGGGSGVGLPIARAIVAAHGGTLTLASAGLGQGATATVALPRGAAQHLLASDAG